jgi:hypothetical protein
MGGIIQYIMEKMFETTNQIYIYCFPMIVDPFVDRFSKGNKG